MANRQQRRASKKMLNRPELKKYVDQFCMEVSTMLVDSCEQAKEESEKDNKSIDFSKIQSHIEESMKTKGEDLGNKVKEIMQQHNKKSNKPNIRTNIRSRAEVN